MNLFLIILGSIIIFILFAFFYQNHLLKKGKLLIAEKEKKTNIEKIKNLGTIESFSVIPLIDSESISEQFKTENGVSMFIKTNNKNIILDLGFNRKKEHPSPLLQNMKRLNLNFNSIDAIFFSHAHLDHLGGMQEQKHKEFSISHGKTKTPSIPVYSPIKIKPSSYNSQLNNIIVSNKPQIIWPGIASIGSISRQLYIMGYIEEQAFVFNLKNKGLIIIVGCGHQTIERIIERTKKLFDEKIYAIIGGLHFPLLKKSPFSLIGLIQYIVGSDRPFWNGLSEKDLENAIESIKKENVQFVGISSHDSSIYSINKFKKAFGEKYIDVKVGKEIIL